MNIDVTRGVEIRRDRSTGVRVYMYVDEPGVYLNAFGKPIAEAFAAKAGFPVDQYARQRIAREKISDFTKKLQHDMEVASLTEDREEITKRGGYVVYRMPFGNAVVVSEEGENLTDRPIAEAQAMELLEALAGPAEVKEPVVVEPVVKEAQNHGQTLEKVRTKS